MDICMTSYSDLKKFYLDSVESPIPCCIIIKYLAGRKSSEIINVMMRKGYTFEFI